MAETSANHDDSQEPTDDSVRRIQKLEMETEELQEENQRIKTAHETNLGAHMLMANKLQQQPVPQMQGTNGGDEILVSKLKVEPAEQKSNLKSICVVANSQQTEIEQLRTALDENLSAQGMLSTAKMQEHEGIFEVGEKVEAKWSKGASYYPGEISCRNADGTYNIQFEDGDKDENTKSEHIRRPEIKSAGRFVPLNERTSGGLSESPMINAASSMEQAILRDLEKSSSGAGIFTGKGSGARRRAIRRFRNLIGHKGEVTSVAINAQYIVSASKDNTIEVYQNLRLNH